VLYFLNFSPGGREVMAPRSAPAWTKVLDSREKEWNKDGAERACMPATLNGGTSFNIEGLSVVVYKATS
jgi:hypothetical protein